MMMMIQSADSAGAKYLRPVSYDSSAFLDAVVVDAAVETWYYLESN